MDPVRGASNTHTTIDPDIHRQKRRAIGPAFTEQSLRDFEPTVWRQVETFQAQLRSFVPLDDANAGWSAPINMAAACRHFTLDTIGAFAFGRSLDLQTKVENRGMIDAMRAAMYVTGIVYNYPKLKPWGLSKWIKVKGGWTQQQWGALTKCLIEERLSRSVDARADMFAFALGGKHGSDVKIPLDDLWVEARLALLAGEYLPPRVSIDRFCQVSRPPAGSIVRESALAEQ